MKFTTSILALAGLAAAHMEMTDPAPYRSKKNPNTSSGDVDHDMTSPLFASGANFPCKGYQSALGTPAGKSVKTYIAGQKSSITIEGGAPHGGGSCQVALSSDKAATWKVMHSWIGDCPVQGSGTFDFTIPSDTPAGEYIFAWTWFNKIGNREMYMNCATVTITGASAKMRRAPAAVAFSARPNIFVANVGNGCSTTEGTDLLFPDPGPDVTNVSKNTAPGVGNCAKGSGSPPPAASKPAASQPAATQPAASQPPTNTQPSAASSSLPGGVFATVSPVASSQAPVSQVPVSQVPATSAAPVASSAPAPVTPSNGSGYSAGTACSKEGEWNCIGGKQFQRCASGTWSAPQAVAAGTACTPGQSTDFVIAAAK